MVLHFLLQCLNYMFMATPASVDVSGEFQDTLTGAFENF